MKKNIIILAAIIACLCSCSEENNVSSFSFEVTPQIVADNDAAEYNYSRTLFLRDSVKAVITYSEDWHDIAEIRKGEKKVTGGPGVTSAKFKNGQRVSYKDGEKALEKHLEKYVFPAMCFVTREMRDEEIIAACDFVYNLGIELFCQHHADGTFADKGCQSMFYQGLCKGDSPKQLARYITGFRACPDGSHNGIMSRRWLEGAIITKNISARQLAQIPLGSLNGIDWRKKFTKAKPDSDGFYTPDFKQAQKWVKRYTRRTADSIYGLDW